MFFTNEDTVLSFETR